MHIRHRWLIGFVVAAALLAGEGVPLSARAADAGTTPDWVAPVLPPCTCRAQGRLFDMGETTCLSTTEGPRLAICAMDQNVSAWKPTARTCPSASRARISA